MRKILEVIAYISIILILPAILISIWYDVYLGFQIIGTLLTITIFCYLPNKITEWK